MNENAELDREIGVRLRRERRRQELTSIELAALAGVHRNTISRAEHGRGISLAAICSLAAALEVPLDLLIPVDAVRRAA